MKIKIATPNKNEFVKFEITLDKKDFKTIVDYTVETYIRSQYDLDLYDEKTIVNAVSECEEFKKNVVSDILLDLNNLLRLPKDIFNGAGLGPAWEKSPVCQKIEQDIKSEKSKNEESKEIRDAKKLLKNFGYNISKQ